MIVYEYRKTTKRTGKPILLPEETSMKYPDYTFRSVYGYPVDTADFIRTSGNTRGLKNKGVYSDVLLIDTDTTKETEEVLHLLRISPYSFEHYNTGHRGGHFHIPIVPMLGTQVVYSQKQWLKTTGIWELVDTSIYKEGGQYRLIDAFHHKTGNQKVLEEKTDRELLNIPLITPPPIAQEKTTVVEGTPEARQEYVLNLLASKSEGSRHMHFYIIYKRGIEAGLTPEEIYEDIRWYNHNLCDPPHPDSELEKKFGGFR